jgi:hypothetical protein
MPDSPQAPYKICCSERDRQALKTLTAQAIEAGLGRQYASALKAIVQHLHEHPLEWGDPNYHLRHMGLLVHHGMVPPLQVFYAVDEPRRLVYIQEIRRLAGQRPETGDPPSPS